MKRLATCALAARGLLAAASATLLMAAQPALALPGLYYHSEQTETSLSHVNPTLGLTVPCPRGKQVVSGGAAIHLVGAGARIIALEPDTENGAWFRAEAALESSYPDNVPWILEVYIICADPPRGGLHYNKVEMRPSRDATQWTRPYCGTGEKLVGFGGRVATDTEPRNVALTAVVPAVDLNSVLVQGTEMEAGEESDWSVTAYTVCTLVDGAYAASAASWGPPSGTVEKFTSPSCVGLVGQYLHAIGGVVLSGMGHAVIRDFFYQNSLSTGQMIAFQDLSGAVNAWSLYAVAICGPNF